MADNHEISNTGSNNEIPYSFENPPSTPRKKPISKLPSASSLKRQVSFSDDMGIDKDLDELDGISQKKDELHGDQEKTEAKKDDSVFKVPLLPKRLKFTGKVENEGSPSKKEKLMDMIDLEDVPKLQRPTTLNLSYSGRSSFPIRKQTVSLDPYTQRIKMAVLPTIQAPEELILPPKYPRFYFSLNRENNSITDKQDSAVEADEASKPSSDNNTAGEVFDNTK